MLKAQAENVKRLDGFYRGGAVPVSLMAEQAGRSIFQIMDHLTCDDDLFVNCVHGDEVAFKEAEALLADARGIVLDGTAVWTLRELGAIDVLRALPIAFGNVQQSLDAVEKECASEIDSPEGGGRLGDMAQLKRASWKEVRVALQAGQTLSSTALAEMPANRREQLTPIVGEWAAHVMAAAKQRGYVLWSDDRVLEFLGKEFFGVSRVWSQAVFTWLRGKGVIDDARLRQVSAKLQASRYSGTFVDAGVLVQAARLADWNLNSIFFERNLRPLVASTTDPRVCAAMALGLIAACMTDVRLSTTQNTIITSILARLKTRDRSLRIVHHVLRLIPAAMRLNPLGAHGASKIVRAWLIAE